MAATGYTFTKCTQHLAVGQINWTSGTYKVILMGSGFAAIFNKDTLDSYNDVKAQELPTANGYTIRGFTVTSKTAVAVGASHFTPAIGSNVSWTTAGGQTLTAYWALLYLDSGTDSTSYLVAANDFGGAITASNGGSLTGTSDATNGWWNVVAA
jgi:hypothetical protein